MSTSTLLIKHLAQTYDAIQGCKSAMQKKLDCLKESQPYYKLIEIEGERHPYFDLVVDTQVMEVMFSKFVAALMDWEIDGITVSEELHKVQKNQKQPLLAYDALSAIVPVQTSVSACADLLLDLVKSIVLFRSRCDTARVKDSIKKILGINNPNMHIEVPLQNITAECNAAYKRIKLLSKFLLNILQNQTTLREQLEMKQSMFGLTSIGGISKIDSTITLMLEL